MIALVATPRRAPRDINNLHAGQGMLGVLGPEVLPSEQSIKHYNPIEAIGVGAVRSWDDGGADRDLRRPTRHWARFGQSDRRADSASSMVSGQVASCALDVPGHLVAATIGGSWR